MPSGRRHYRITEADAYSAHERALHTGGLPGIPQPDQVLSSIGRPYSGYYRRIEKKAAALFQGVATGHGFADGNKRTAVILTILLLEESGYRLEPKDPTEALDVAIETLAISVVEDKLPLDDIVAWFKARIRRA